MIYRIKQFYRGLFAKVHPQDQRFLEKYLSDKEISLFYQLRIAEQRHCLNIAYDCLKIKKNNPTLIKAALLHDIGKVGSNLTLINKALVVLSIKFRIPKKMLPTFLTKALYYKENHPEIGGTLLRKIGTEKDVILLSRYHHLDSSSELPQYRESHFPNALIETLQVLQKIDEKN